ncbi:hypothetical protein AAULR_21232 [Lacticaseibacillus rhamnosus MTCC 5462]|nr:hypothetical protein AAULR_21232 [Lacticaseibacillus rhamnosus MTCC 5462]
MKLSVPLVNGQLDDRYGKHATGADVKTVTRLRVFRLRLKMPLQVPSVLPFGSSTMMPFRLAVCRGFTGTQPIFRHRSLRFLLVPVIMTSCQ